MPCEGHRRKSCRRNRVKPARGLIVGMPWFGVCAPSYGRRGRASRQRPEIVSGYRILAPRMLRGGRAQGEPQSYFTVASIRMDSASSHPLGTGAS